MSAVTRTLLAERGGRIDLLLRARVGTHDAHALRAADRKVRTSVIAVDDTDRRRGGVAARAAHRGEDLALARIGERMEARERADVIEIRDHVRIKDDLDGIREERECKGRTEGKEGNAHCLIV